MKIPYRYRPGTGFLLLIVVTVLVVAFALWGLSEPPLERTWRLLEQVDHGHVLSADEFAFMDEALRSYPGITKDILDEESVDLLEPDVEGFSVATTTHLLLAPLGPEGRRFEVSCQGASLHPVTVSLSSAKLNKTLRFAADGTQTLTITGEQASAGPTAPFLVRVEVDGDFAASGWPTTEGKEQGIRFRAQAPGAPGRPGAPGARGAPGKVEVK